MGLRKQCAKRSKATCSDKKECYFSKKKNKCRVRKAYRKKGKCSGLGPQACDTKDGCKYNYSKNKCRKIKKSTKLGGKSVGKCGGLGMQDCEDKRGCEYDYEKDRCGKRKKKKHNNHVKVMGGGSVVVIRNRPRYFLYRRPQYLFVGGLTGSNVYRIGGESSLKTFGKSL